MKAMSSWPAQVAHVARKDFRELRWPLAGYAVFVIGATAHALGSFAPRIGLLDYADAFIGLFSVIVAINIVQADAPADEGAFWVTRPLSATAVLVSKFLFLAVAILALPAIGQWLVLQTLWPMTTAVESTLRGAAGMMLLLVPTVLVAALTRSMQTCILACLLLLFATSVMAQVLELLHLTDLRATDAAGFAALAAVGGALMYAYVRRDIPRRVLFACLVVVNVLYGSGTPELDLSGISLDPPAASQSRPEIDFEHIYYDSSAGRLTASARLHVQGARSSEQVIVLDPRIAFTTATGSRREVRFDSRYVMFSSGDSLIPVGHGSWYSSDQRHAAQMDNQPSLDRAASERLRAPGNSHFALEGRVLIRVPEFLGTIPLDGTPYLMDHGNRVSVSEQDASENTVRLKESILERESSTTSWQMEQLRPTRYALVDDSLRYAIPLRAGSGGSHSHGMLLPGATRRESDHVYQDAESPGKRPLLTHPRVIAFRMKPAGSYPIHVELREKP